VLSLLLMSGYLQEFCIPGRCAAVPLVNSLRPTPERIIHSPPIITHAGCTDILAMDLSNLLTSSPAPSSTTNTTTSSSPTLLPLHMLGSTPPRDPLSSEGIALVLLPQPAGSAPVLLAIGGYNGKYHNTVSVLRAPALPAAHQDTMDAITSSSSSVPAPAAEDAPAAPGDSNGDASGSQRIAANGKVVVIASGPTAAAAAPAAAAVVSEPVVSEVQKLRSEVERLTGELARAHADTEAAVSSAAAAKAGGAHELALLRKQLATSQAALETASKVLVTERDWGCVYGC
jgi:hypothetical protein